MSNQTNSGKRMRSGSQSQKNASKGLTKLKSLASSTSSDFDEQRLQEYGNPTITVPPKDMSLEPNANISGSNSASTISNQRRKDHLIVV